MKYRTRHLSMIHARSFDSFMKRATSFTACCTPTWLMDMQLVRTVALLNVDALSLSNFGSIWRVHSCTYTTGVCHCRTRSRRPGSSSHARFLGAADLLQFRSGSEIEMLMTVLSSPQESFFWTINPQPSSANAKCKEKSMNKVITMHEPTKLTRSTTNACW